jgi:hypothetical protein
VPRDQPRRPVSGQRASAAVVLGGFVVWENVTAGPMVPLVLFRRRNFSGGSLSLALVEIGIGGLMLVLTQYLQFVLGYSPIKAGRAFVPLAVTALAGNTTDAKVAAKIGNRFLVLARMLVMASSFALLVTVSADRASPSRWPHSACSVSARPSRCRPPSER